jgi:hypothetical protein
MTTDTAAVVSVEAIDAALGAATPALSEDEQRLAVAVFRLLATGQPVTIRLRPTQPRYPRPAPPPSCDRATRCSGTTTTRSPDFSGMALAQ